MPTDAAVMDNLDVPPELDRRPQLHQATNSAVRDHRATDGR